MCIMVIFKGYIHVSLQYLLSHVSNVVNADLSHSYSSSVDYVRCSLIKCDVLFPKPPRNILFVVHISLEDFEIHLVEALQVVHHWIPDLHHSVAFHCLAALLNAGM